MLKLQFRDQPDQHTKLAPPVVTIGRDPKNQLVVGDASVSDFHAEITVDGRHIYIMDLLSSSGTYVNEKLISGRQELEAWDVIRVGTVELEVNDPGKRKPDEWALRTDSDLLLGQHFILLPKTTVGRDPECDLTITSEHLSRQHAEIHIEDGQLRVVDLESRNGTFLNCVRITEAFAKPGDEIRFDRQAFIVAGPVSPEIQDGISEDEQTRLRVDSGDETVVQVVEDDAPEVTFEEETLIVSAQVQFDAYLIEQENSAEPSRIKLVGPIMTIGRGEENNLVIPDNGVSKRHAQIVDADEQWTIEDLGSSNGIFVNGERMTKACLRSGDKIQLGKHEFRYEKEQAATEYEVDESDRTVVFTAPQNSQSQPAPGKRKAKVKGRAKLPSWLLGTLLFAICVSAAAIIFLIRKDIIQVPMDMDMYIDMVRDYWPW